MKINDIIEILRNDNTSYLWDLPKPKWEAIDYYNLNQIKQGKEYINKKRFTDYVEPSDKTAMKMKAQEHRMKLIRRISDGVIFKGLNELARQTGLRRTALSKALNNSPNTPSRLIGIYEFVNQ